MKSLYGSITRSAVISLSYVTVMRLPSLLPNAKPQPTLLQFADHGGVNQIDRRVGEGHGPQGWCPFLDRQARLFVGHVVLLLRNTLRPVCAFSNQSCSMRPATGLALFHGALLPDVYVGFMV